MLTPIRQIKATAIDLQRVNQIIHGRCIVALLPKEVSRSHQFIVIEFFLSWHIVGKVAILNRAFQLQNQFLLGLVPFRKNNLRQRPDNDEN